MANRNLTPEQLEAANKLLELIRERLSTLAEGDPELLFAFRRKIAKKSLAMMNAASQWCGED